MKSMFNKAKPVLITALIAVAAVYVWNTFIAPRVSGAVGRDLSA